MIWFVGAGPGDPELLTIKGYKLLNQADVVVYAGSLVNEALLQNARPGARLINSAFLNLEEIVAVMIEAYRQGEQVVRLHTGDPSLSGLSASRCGCWTRPASYAIVPGKLLCSL